MVNSGVILIGGGGHGRVILDALRLAGAAIVGVVDPDPNIAPRLAGAAYLGGDEELLAFAPDSVLLANGIGSVGRPELRQAIHNRFTALGYRFATIVHPTAVLAKDVTLGQGVQVMAGTVIQTGSTIGAGTIINTGALVDHDCCIGEHSHIAPGVTLSGAVEVGPGCHIGAGAIVLQRKRIGAGTVVGAGALVRCNLPDSVTAFTSMELRTISGEP